MYPILTIAPSLLLLLLARQSFISLGSIPTNSVQKSILCCTLSTCYQISLQINSVHSNKSPQRSMLPSCTMVPCTLCWINETSILVLNHVSVGVFFIQYSTHNTRMEPLTILIRIIHKVTSNEVIWIGGNHASLDMLDKLLNYHQQTEGVSYLMLTSKFVPAVSGKTTRFH
jgi:hypothetical protein